ncbi:hypothetical protein JAB8_38290 [Janthinobacterium sp. HH106]|uniref:gp53-like domain-containing protein n=1 Tax=Janthinobacterium sp. HH106 TaxID=1537278 RepID=UPI000874749C|nr:hypothetical protein [Janthinobacterium sp. HH106]OEZ85647.1 hypothetical protein JAB8_38290 [Janthinobacterium sp. HH106]
MYRIDDPSAAAALPEPEAAGREGFFTEGVPGVKEATLVRASFLNMLQEELRNIVLAAGVVPAKADYTQLLKALRSAGVFQTAAQFDNTTKVATMAAVRNELLGLGNSVYAAIFGASLAPNGWRKLPSGEIMQWGYGSTSDGSGTSTVTFPTAFPTALLHIFPFYESSGNVPSTNPSVINAGITSLSGAKIFTWNGITISGGITPSYIAIGK